MGRKRDVPFKTGKLEIWAAAVVQAIVSVNFLFDNSFEPYISSKELHDFFGTKTTTLSAKSRIIREMFNISHFSAEFYTNHMNSSKTMNNFIMIDGIISPISMLPDDLQELLLQERERGGDLGFFTKYK